MAKRADRSWRDNMQQQPMQQQMNIDPNDLTDIECSNARCLPGGMRSKNFRQVFQMKKLSALMSPTGQEQVVTIPVFICDHCGEPLRQDMVGE